MTRSEFTRVASQFGLELARYSARVAGILPAVIDLWSLGHA